MHFSFCTYIGANEWQDVAFAFDRSRLLLWKTQAKGMA